MGKWKGSLVFIGEQVYEKEKSALLHLKIDLVSNPAIGEGLGKYILALMTMENLYQMGLGSDGNKWLFHIP